MYIGLLHSKIEVNFVNTRKNIHVLNLKIV